MHWVEYNDSVSFQTRNSIFFDNIAGKYSEKQKVEIFRTDIYDGEYEVSCSPENEEDLKEICDVLASYSDSYEDLATNTQDFLENGYLHDLFRELFGKEEGTKIVNDAIKYTQSLFEKS